MPLNVGALAGARAAASNAQKYQAMQRVAMPPKAAASTKQSPRTLVAQSRPSRSTEDSDSSEGLEDEEDPPQGSCVWRHAHDLIEGPFWTALVMTAIAANTLMMAVQCNYPNWPHWHVFEDGFLIFFTVEMAFRLYVYRLSFFTNADERPWNIFDLLVVASGILDAILQRVLAPGKQGGSIMVVFRIVRIVRILRSCRLLKHFKQLYLLLQGFLHSLQAVFWIGVLFFLVVLIAGIVVTSMVGANAKDWARGPHAEPGDEEKIEELFGSLARSMVTMFQLVTLDNWGDINTLVSKQMPLMTVFFILYILTTAFAMIALLTGVITENVTAVSRESEQAEEEARFQAYVETLAFVFQHAEAYDGQEGITFEDLRRLLLEDPKVAGKMELNETNISPSDLRDIFQAMDYSGDGRVSWDEFRHGLRDMHGQATAKEVALLRADMVQLRTLVGRIAGVALPAAPRGADVGQRISSLEGQVKRLESSVQGFLGALGG